jgi:predicted hydrocarbon binding protein
MLSETKNGSQVKVGNTKTRGNYFAEANCFHTNVRRGVTHNRSGTRIIALSEDFLRGLRAAVIDECGPAADTVFRTCGRRYGELFAKRFEKEMTEFYGQKPHDFIFALFNACLVELFNHHGWGLLRMDFSRHDRGVVIITLDNAIMADLIRQAERPTDTLFAGIFAGFFSYLSGQELDCVQTACKAKGDPTSRFVVGLAPRLKTALEGVAQGLSHDALLPQILDSRVE